MAVRKLPRAERVLVVDDEPSIVDAVATALRYEGFAVDEAVTGRMALRMLQDHRFDLVILDVMLPDIDGFAVARRMRAEGLETPVLFLTARDAITDKVDGLTVGDDYVTKPFLLAEVVARVQAILRRSRTTGSTHGHLQFADVVLDDDAHQVTRGGVPVRLTATEFRLLRYFLANPRRVLSKAQILDAVWYEGFDGDANIVETYVRYLRKKLEALGPPLLDTIRLVGYILREPEAD